MPKTTVPGNRIRRNSIRNEHLHPDFTLSEEHVDFNLALHEHLNKGALDILSNSIPATLTALDLKDVFYGLIELSDARDSHKTLRETLEARVTNDTFKELEDEIREASAGYISLGSYLDMHKESIQAILDSHMGSIAHVYLDALYAEVNAARGEYVSLKERLDNIAHTGGSGGDINGNVSIVTLTPWHYETTVEAGKTVVELTNTYTPGICALHVFDGPLLLTAGIDYEETDTTHITLIEPLAEPVVLRIMGVNAGRLFEWERRVQGDGSIDYIELSDSYRPHHRDLVIYEDGLLLREVEDYIELSPHTLSLVRPLESGSTLSIYKRRV